MQIAHCRSCNAEIVWLKTSKGKNMPVDADFMALQQDITDAAPEFDYATHKDGVHWATCPNAEEHRKK